MDVGVILYKGKVGENGGQNKIPHAMPCGRELLNPEVQVVVRMMSSAIPDQEGLASLTRLRHPTERCWLNSYLCITNMVGNFFKL